MLNIVGRVLPATLDVVRLCAELDDGSDRRGRVGRFRWRSGRSSASSSIRRRAEPLDEVIDAIREADAIVLGPGRSSPRSLPNLLVDRIADEIAASSAVKMYVCNVMTQPGETDRHDGVGDTCARSSSNRRRARLRLRRSSTTSAAAKACSTSYAQEGQVPVRSGRRSASNALGVEAVEAPVISETNTVRHDPRKAC